VLDLKQGPGFDAMALTKKRIAGLPDLERLLARLHAVGSGSGRHADKVVLYEVRDAVLHLIMLPVILL
jgi:hypothetical protein